MNHAPSCTEFPQDIPLTRRMMLLVITVVVGALLGLSATGIALADDDHDCNTELGNNCPKADFVIPMNYELGMHCTGFEFAYCCVLPAYNSILAQVIKTQDGKDGFAELLEADPINGLDFLGRETVLRDKTLVNGQFQKYVLKYEHHAQPRTPIPGKVPPIVDSLISDVELNSLLSWNTVYDAADTVNGALVTGSYHGAQNVVLGDGDYDDPNDNYQNGVWNHLYFYEDLEGTNSTGTSLEANKIRLGMPNDTTGFPVIYPVNSGPAFHPMGPAGNNNPNSNVLTFSEDSGTVVFTQMKVLENLPIMLTSPRIWEALGLPLTPFEDTIGFFNDPGAVDEEAIRPYVKMQATMFHFDAAAPDGAGAAVIDSSGNPVIAFGTAPIDIPNCERCHSAPGEKAPGVPNVNSPNVDPAQQALVDQEIAFWKAYYPSMQTGSDWYARLKGAAISILSVHDDEHGTMFTKAYTVPGFGTTPAYPGADCTDVNNCANTMVINPDNPGAVNPLPQNTRLGNESVICQKCHADNVIAVVKSANCGPDNNCDITAVDDLFENIAGNDPLTGEGHLIPSLTEAIHWNHRNVSEGGNIVFNDGQGRDGGCQGCHPAHRSDGNMDGYPITLDGDNFYANSDNRVASGGCFVGRDVHSNPLKDEDGAETPSHLNAVGQWLADNVANDGNGIWCTNCHSQLGQELWKAENCEDLINGDCATNPRAEPTLAAVAEAVGTTEAQAIAWLDPKNDPANPTAFDPNDQTHAIWAPDPGMCDHVATLFGAPANPAQDANVATIEVALPGQTCSTPVALPGPDCDDNGSADFSICGSVDGDGDFSVSLLDFCTTPDCVTAAQATLTNSAAVPVPFSAATDGRDHWLSPGEPHCADCHAAPYTEPSGTNLGAVDDFGRTTFYPPFNYPRKASLMRYSRGHRDITCQGCHESIHGLYPVTPTIDTTTYAQAAQWNSDDTHGPLKCGSCHEYRNVGPTGQVPTRVCEPGESEGECKSDGEGLSFAGMSIFNDYDAAVSWAHTFTDQQDPRQDLCLNCHDDEANEIARVRDGTVDWEEEWLEHADEGRVSRKTMDQVEILQIGHVAGDPAEENPLETVCEGCHGDNKSDDVRCNEEEWKEHLTKGRVATEVWEYVSVQLTGSTCGW